MQFFDRDFSCKYLFLSARWLLVLIRAFYKKIIHSRPLPLYIIPIQSKLIWQTLHKILASYMTQNWYIMKLYFKMDLESWLSVVMLRFLLFSINLTKFLKVWPINVCRYINCITKCMPLYQLHHQMPRNILHTDVPRVICCIKDTRANVDINQGQQTQLHKPLECMLSVPHSAYYQDINKYIHVSQST
jgi:hypothetical protein